MKHLPGGQVVQHQGVDYGRVECVRDLDRPLGRNEDVAGVTPGSDERGDSLADRRSDDVRVDSHHVADDIETHDRRKPPGVAALSGGDVVERHPSSFHLDEHEAGAWNRYRRILDGQLVGAACTRQRNNGHSGFHEAKHYMSISMN